MLDQSNIVNIIIEVINSIFNNLFTSIDNSIFTNLDNIAFIDKSIISSSFFQKILGSDGKNGLLYLTDAMLVGICLFYCVKYFYSHYAETNIEKPYQFIFKLLIFAIIINSSYFFMEQILYINNLISNSIQEIGKNILNCNITFSELILKVNKSLSLEDNTFTLFSMDGLIKSFISISLLNLIFTYSIRYVLVQVLILFTPFAILSLINSSTSWIFRSWSKCLFTLLIIQNFFPLIIMIIFLIGSSNKILLVAGITILTKINSYVREMFGGLGIEANNNLGAMMSLLKK